MKRCFKVLSLIIFVFVIQLSVVQSGFASQSSAKNITILFTHDLHDHETSYNVESDGTVTQVGGYARLKTAIDAEKQKDPNALLLDAGDFSMGSLFQTIFSSDSPELRLLGQLGYDVTTFGNHEFDFKAEGLTQSLNAAKSSGDTLPQIVTSNITYPTDKDGKMDSSVSDLKTAMENYGVKDYSVIERGGIKIGVFGLMGSDAASDSPFAGVQFADEIESAKQVVDVLKNTEKVDLIICLSHSGTWTDESKSEDEILAKKVPDINVIISGHTHTLLDKPIVVGNTIIGSCGCYGQYLGEIKLSQDSAGTWTIDNYNMELIDDKLAENPDITASIAKFEDIVQAKYLGKFNLKFNQVLAYSTINFTDISDLESKHAEDTLGDLLSDSYIYTIKQTEGQSYEPIAAAIIPAGTIRGSFYKGNVTVADSFSAASLGIGEDGISGYPLISVYLTGKELKATCEVDASITALMPDAQLYMSGLSFSFNPNRLIFNKVTSASLTGDNGKEIEIDDNKLYRVVASIYSGQMLSKASSKSMGIIAIVPKDKNGEKISDFNAQIIRDGSGSEIKEWQAVAAYMQSFDKVNGVSQIPDYYAASHDRKVVVDSHSLAAILGSPNSFALIVYLIVIVIAALIVFAIVRIATRKTRREKRRVKSMK
jgi:5'-nucleotidase / UDP-sugar diphosphatase